VVDNVNEYCVVVDRKSNSSDILRNSAMKEQRGQNETLIMKSKISKRQAIER